MSMLKVEGLNVYYGSIHAIKGVSFEVNQGEIVTMIGANGAGKSTTMNTVAGLLKPKSGSITFEGHDITSTPASKVVSLGLALCPEGRRVFQQMSVRTSKWAATRALRVSWPRRWIRFSSSFRA